jgi:hypothetical protein
MSLSPERAGQIALVVLQQKMEEDGVRLNPRNIKRDLVSESKRLGIPLRELAEFVSGVMKTAYEKTIAEIDKIIVDSAKTRT